MYKVAVVYHVWPHYRAGVMEALEQSMRVDFHFFGSGEVLEGIEHVDVANIRHFHRAPSRRIGGLTWQSEAVDVGARGEYDAIIYLGDIHFLSTWIGAAVARLRGLPVLFWAHGWLRPEHGVRRLLRQGFYRLANMMLVYGERAKRLGEESGYPADRIRVVYNSLDVARADDVVDRIESGALATLSPRDLFADRGRPLLICTARLTPACRFDLLIEAAALLREQGLAVNVLLVGDGPERPALERLAAARGIDAHFFGACYEEDVTGQLLYHADVTVSPGKIGLTAMHSLMYGTPAITHDSQDDQMPEVEAITPGLTGDLFRKGDAVDLAARVAAWLQQGRPRDRVRADCRAVIHQTWNPQHQARIIEGAVVDLVAGN